MTQGERITALETGTTLMFKEIKEDITEIKTTVNSMDRKMPELQRQVKEHHAVFPEHKQMINALKEANCPNIKVMPNNNINRDRNERKTDQPRYKYLVWSAVVTGACGIITAVVVAMFK